MASDLQVAIATHGLVQSEAVQAATEYLLQTKERKVKETQQDITVQTENDCSVVPNIEVINENEETDILNKDVKEVKAKKNSNNSEVSKNSEGFLLPERLNYDDALKDVEDPLIPVQGHGLIAFKTLIAEKDPKTMQNCDKLVLIFKQCILHEDTYVYLSAIQALAGMAHHRPDEVLPLLVQEYTHFEEHDEKISRSIESRTKVGEVIVKVTREMGIIIDLFYLVLCGSVNLLSVKAQQYKM